MSRYSPVHFLVDGGLFLYNLPEERRRNRMEEYEGIELDDDLFPIEEDVD